jgi:hypothetical protein
LREAGYARVELDVFAFHSDALGVEPFARPLSAEQFLPLVDEGLLSFEEFVRAYALTGRFLASPDPFVMIVGFIARAEKPR